jgi:hypothetical protein
MLKSIIASGRMKRINHDPAEEQRGTGGHTWNAKARTVGEE